MDLEITPRPTPEERVAITTAVTSLLADGIADLPGAWWLAGLPEPVDDDEVSESSTGAAL